MRRPLLLILVSSIALGAWNDIPTGSIPTQGTNGQCLVPVTNGTSAAYTWTTCGGGGSYPWTVVTMSGDITDSTLATDTNLTGLLMAVSASTNYRMKCRLVTDAAAATTGVRVGITGPASPTQLTWSRTSCASAAASAFASLNTYAVDARTASAGTTRCVEELNLILRNGLNAGTVQLTVNTEIDTSAVGVRIGSYCEWQTF